MLVSVVVPTRNRSALLGMTLQAVLRQRDVSMEIIVVDDGSVDDTPAVIAKFGHASIRSVRHRTPHGVSAARNRGISVASGEWIAFLDDDDLWAPDKLARQLHAAQAASREWVYAGSVNIGRCCRILHGTPPPPPEEVVAALPRYNAVPAGGSNVMVRREVLLRAGPFDRRLANTEDWEMWIRLAKNGPPAYVCSPLVAYRVHASTASLDIAQIMSGIALIERLHDTTVDRGRFYWWIAQLSLRSGRRIDALHYYLRAVVKGPRHQVWPDLARVARQAVRRRLGGAAVAPARHVDAVWEDQARKWIEELRALDPTAKCERP